MRIRSLRYVPFVVRRAVSRRFPLLPKLHPARLTEAIGIRRDPDHYVFVDWNPNDRNWGDALNEYLVERLTGRQVRSSRYYLKPDRCEKFSVIGSVLGLGQPQGTVVWGAGFLKRADRLPGPPKRVVAVRGPLTAGKLQEEGVDIDGVVFGDPAVLMPLLYRPVLRSRYRLGVVPHYADTGSRAIDRLRSRDDVLIIDVGSGIEDFVDQLISCDVIASSALHGLIAADAYGLPRVWLKLSDHVTGDTFKFEDYFLGAGLGMFEYISPDRVHVADYARIASESPISRDVLSRLLDSCPLPGFVRGQYPDMTTR
jgi:pyruvyltransferase